MEYQSGAVSPVGSFSKGWDIIKNDYWMYVLMMLILGVIVIVASLVLGTITNVISSAIAGAVGVATSNSGDVTRASAAVLPQIIAQVIGIFTNIIVVTVMGVLLCGVYKSFSRVANGGRAEVGDLFSGFEHLQACFIYAIIYSVIQFGVAIVMLLGFAAVGFSALGLGIASIITKDGQIDTTILSGLFMVILAYVAISIVIGLIIAALTTFVYPLIAERNLSGIQALGLSIKGGLANLIGLILLLILGGLMLFAGAIPCLIGLPFVAPIYFAALYAAYRSVFGSVSGYQNYNPPPPPNFGNQPPPNFSDQPRY